MNVRNLIELVWGISLGNTYLGNKYNKVCWYISDTSSLLTNNISVKSKQEKNIEREHGILKSFSYYFQSLDSR